MNKIKYFLVIQFIFTQSLCEINNDQKEKFLSGFLKYYNSLPNQVYQSEEGSIQSTQQEDDTTYKIEANLKVAEISNDQVKKSLKCVAFIKDSDNEVTVLSSNCEEAADEPRQSDGVPETSMESHIEVTEPTVERKPVQLDNEVQQDTAVTEPTVERKPVQLDNEVQQDTAITSGEQFIAIPRDQPRAPCIGCASHVNPQAAGVSDLAELGVRHLDLHEPSVKHSLATVLDVERQVQVVNGVRYLLTLSINFNNCTQVESENCASSKVCKITILVKPWVKLSNGGNYRAILANNCTEEWQFGDNAEVLPEPLSDNNQKKENSSGDPADTNTFDDDIQVKHDTNVQSQPNQEKTLSEDDIKNIQEQIITDAQFQAVTESNKQSFTLSPDLTDVSKQHVFKAGSEKHNENSIPVTESQTTEQQAFKLNEDKKKAIDEMLDFFDFAGFKPKTEVEEAVPRVRRSYDYDLQVLSLAEDYHGIKNSILNARFMYEMAQAMVDYMNEMDMEVKNRAVKNVIRAEEEKEDLHRFVYIQARVTIPCDKVECEPREVNAQICNGVIDCINENSPQILSTFCYNDNKESDYREDIREVALNDPVLRRLAEEAVKEIESESKSQYAMRLNKIASAITQVTSGTLTKFSVIIENIKCNKSVPLPLRQNCTVLEQLGSKICDVIVHERHWLKEKKMSYSCTDRPADMRISNSKKISNNITVDDPQIIEMLQEAIQYLESQSDKSNKQKIVNIKSISSQIIAGFLTKIEFVVGYTDCTDDNYSRDQINKCELLKDERLRLCKAQIWDRSWVMDGRQIEVSCDDVLKNNEILKTRKKRSIDFGRDDQQILNKDSEFDYKKLANESLYKFMQSSSSNQHYEVVKVDKTMVPDVSRKLIKIEFSISPTNCLIQSNGILSSSTCNIVNPKNILHCRSKILENNWFDKKQYFVKCNIKYQQQIKNTNTIKERNPSDSKYYQLAAESLKKYLHDTGNPPHTIVRLEKVTTQIVAGLLTKIDFIVSPKNLSNSETVRCHSDILEKHWMETKAFNVSCQLKQDVKTMDHTVEIHANNPKYMQIAVESLQKYIKNHPESNLVRVAFVDKVERKSEKLKIRFIASHAEEDNGDTLCDAEVTETTQFKSDIEVKCYLIDKLFIKADITEDDPNYYKYVQLADESLRNYIQKMNSSFYTVVTIGGVAVLWDDGIKTLINFTISPVDVDNTDLLQGKHCIAEILEQPWLQNSNNKNIQIDCKLDKDLYRTKREALNNNDRSQLGGLQEQNPSLPEYKALAEESLRKYIIDSGIRDPLIVTQVEKVTTQVVAGTMTRIDFLVSAPGANINKCHSEVWTQEWRNFKQITVTCENDGHRGKRQLAGGEQNQDPTKPKYILLAEESLRKHIIDHGIKDQLVVVQVEKVTTQLVAGTLTRIDFLVSGSAGAKINKCHSEIWTQPWINFKQIKVTCESDGQRGNRQLPGGGHYQDPTKPKYRVLAEESLRKHIIDHGIKDQLVVVQVEKVTTQLVAGTLTRIDFLVSGSAGAKINKCHSEIWTQPWINFKQIKVTCESDGHRGKRQLPGGLVDQDPSDPEYRLLAEESLRKYNEDNGISENLVVAQVEKVSTQVVAGKLTRIDFLVSGSPGAKINKCHSEIWTKPWINFKQITVTCESDGHRGKRQLPGGLVDQDPSDPEYRLLAEESLRKYNEDNGISENLVVAQVEKVSTQVVAGKLTRIDFLVSGSPDAKINKCHSEIWTKPWINFKQITVTCESDGHRGKRQLPGGLVDQDPSDPEYRLLAEESLRKYNEDNGISENLVVAQVEKVSTQVVAGKLTRIDFLVSGSPGAKINKCHSEIWTKPWINFKQITVTCESDGHRGKRQLPGGLVDQDPSDPEYRLLAEESLRKYNEDNGISENLVVAQVEKVSTQVVAGKLTRIDFLVSGSPGAKINKCHSEIWTKPWINFKQITVTCESDGHRSKRQLPGGLVDQDPSDPEYRLLAEESLRKYNEDNGISENLVVAQVEKVSTQVVAGKLTRIDFLVSGSPGAKINKCHSEIWTKPWINFKQITVTCESDGHRGKREIMTGGLEEKDPTKPEYRLLAEESLRKHVIDHAIKDQLVVVQVEKVTTQVVAGTMTRIDFLVSGSAGAKINKCQSEIWTQPWINFKQITVTCENDGHRSKRQLPGGLVDQDPSDPEYRLLAEESLRKYNEDNGISENLVVAQVEKVSTQVVAGKLTRIDFLVSGSPGAKINKCHSEIWTKPWINFKQITVTCESDGHRGKRQLPGGLVDQDPSDPEYRLLAEESLRKHIIDHGIKDQLVVVQVEKVTSQVVAGTMTRIDFLVSGSPDAKINKCHSEIWTKPWINFKQIRVTCKSDGHRGKREIMTGGLVDQDPSDPEYRLLAEESLRKHIIDHDIKDQLVVVQVEKVTTQVVAGTMTRIDFLVSGSAGAKTNKCHSEIWTQPWINFKQITVTCENDGHRSKRQMSGGLVDQDPSDPEYRLLAEESLQKHTIDYGIVDHLAVVQVERVTTQVVAGIITRIDFLVSSGLGAEINKCHSEVWTQVWINLKQITVTCENDGHKGKRQIPGGLEEKDPTKPEYRLLAEESLRKYSVENGISDNLVVAQVEKVTTQVVSGTMTRIDFMVSGSPGAKINKCHSEIWTKPWINFKQITVTCESDGHRSKRQLPGGLVDQDPSDPEYRLLAEESLRKYNEDNGISENLVVAQVEKVSTQVVAGKLTRIDFLVSGSPGAKINKCHSEIWTKPWINFKQITVTCESDGHRGKREIMTGGLEEKDPTKPEYRLLAEESLRKHVIDHAIKDQLVVVQVEKVTTQVVAGTMTRIDFLVSGSAGAKINKCQSEIWTQPWINFKQITVTCENDGHRSKRQLPGGLVDQDPSDPEYRLLAEESLRKYNEDNGISENLVVAQVEKVSTQVVAGKLTRIDFLVSGSPGAKINKCHSEIWTKPWINFKQITVTCESDGHRGKRQLPGGLVDQDPSDPEYRLLAEESLRKHIIDHGIKDQLVVVQVEKVTSQVVAGTMTRIDFLVSGSPDAKINKCHSEIWTKPWINFKQIRVTCKSDGHRGKREIMTGGLVDQDPSDPEYRLLAEESLRKHIIDHDIKDQLVVVQVEKVTTQVVAGTMTRIDFLVSGSAGAKTNKCHSEIWTQPWINFKQITVTCENDGHRSKRQMSGGLVDQDPSDPEYRLLAEESLQKHTIDYGIVDHLAVVQVERVTTQVVAGIITRIDFLVSSGLGAEINKCHSEVWTQVWINLKQITVTCENDGHKGKRQIPGGLEEKDPTKPEYRLLAEESLRKYSVENGISDNLVVAQVEKVTTQVVSGTMTRIDFMVSGSPGAKMDKCHSEIWTQPWINFKQITVTCENDGHRSKRQMSGGLVDQDPSDPEYRLLAEESLQKHIIDYGIVDHLAVVQVERVTTQVVAGIITRIDFLVSSGLGAEINKCHSEVWTQVWINFKQITVTCENDGHKGKRQIPGGLEEKDPTKPEYRLLAEESLRKYSVENGISDNLVVAQVEKVTTQAVSGTMTRIDFMVSGSPGAKMDKCRSEIWTQPWINFKQITVTCESDGHRSKRQMTGGLEDQDPTKPEYRLLAEESLRKHIIDHGIIDQLVVVQVEKVTTQVVAGTMTRIDFLVSGSAGAKINKCHSEIWTQPWINFKQITVTCENDGHRGKGQLVGGLEEKDPSKPEYRLLAEESLRKFSEDNGISDNLVVAQVEKVTTQVVSGTMTRIDFLVSGSPDAKINKCHSEIWTQPWINFKQITVTCESDGHRGKRQLPGGLEEKDPTKPEYRLLAEESLRKFGEDNGISDNLVVAQVEKVTTQVVSGTMTRIDFLVSGSPDAKINKCHSEIWTQPWINFKQITVTCESDSHRGKRQLVGGEQNQDPTKPEYRLLAEESLRKYSVENGISDNLVVAQVEKVTTQVVSGTMTRIDFLVSGSPGAKINKCHSEIWTQPWINFKQITVTCENDGHRGKRQLVGGEQNQDPTKPEYRLLAEESLRKFSEDNGISDNLVVAQVEKVTTQVVSGIMTRIDFLVSGSPGAKINKCHSEIWTQPWINFKQITVTCENDGHRGKRQLVGGEQNQDPTKPEYRLLAEESLRKFSEDNGISDNLVVAQVEKVTTQVVSGTMTRIDFLVSGSAGAKINKCHSEIWTQPWINFKQITVTCESDGHRGKRQLVGGEHNQDPTKPEYRLLAEESLRKYSVENGISDNLVVAQVEKVTTQVVSGTVTRIDFLVSGSPGAKINKCHSEIWTQPWINFKQITVTCESDGHRGKRQLPGGLEEKDPTKPEYRLLAEESLRKFGEDNGISDNLVVAQVEKVTTQVVSGTVTRIDFLVSGSPGAKINKCHSEIWTQPWINFKQITVTCESDGHRGKRQLPGGLEEKDPTKPEYRLLAEESLRKFGEDNGISDNLVVAQVEKVTTQVVSGTMTRIDFLVSGSAGAKINKCHSEIWTQPWINFKQITVTCESDGHRGKRQLVGGEHNQDPTKPEYRLLAEESLRKYSVENGISDNLVVAQVEKVTTQVVSGTVTRIDFLVSGSPGAKINKCHSEIWTQPWINFKQITVTCESDGHRGKRQLPGGLEEKDPTKPEYRLLAEESLRKFGEDNGISDNLVVAQVEKVTTQVVSGTMTRIDFLVSGSAGAKINKCHSEIWTQPWINFKQITVTCESDGHRGKRQLVGGEHNQDPTKPEYRLLAEESLRKYSVENGISDNLVVAQVEKVTTQVVSGTVTRIDFLVSGSPGAKINKCHSEIWTQPWINFKQITVTCESDGHRGKRQLPGGLEEKDPTKPEYRLLAEESLRKYSVENGIKYQLVVVQVEKVTTQVVAGTMTRIDFLVSSGLGAEINKCHSAVWTQEWSNIKEITVTCSSVYGRVKRDLGSLSGVLDENISTPMYKILTVQSTRGNASNKSRQHDSTLRGHSEEEQDPSKPEYKLMAEESLRKLYQKKSTVYHTVLDVQHVFTRVVSGIKYKIDFTAAPTACSANVSSLHARSCKAIDDKILYCHTEIWDKPWLKQKKIDVQCNDPNNDNFSEDESDNELPTESTQKSNVDKFIQLAEEATEKYLTSSNRKYVHKVTEILTSSEQVSNDTLTNINFTISPTTCLRNATTNNTLCKLKQPLVVFNCNANIRVRQLEVEKEIKVTCKKVGETEGKKRKSKSGVRTVRQIVDDDDEIDEDTAYYYADRAVQHINDRSSSNNLNKLISIHAVKNSVQMGTMTIKMYIEVAETYCLRHHKTTDLRNCEEMSGLNHRLCLARLWPSPDDELVVRQVSVVCDDEEDFMSITGVNIMELIRISLAVLESPPENKFKLVHQGEPQLIPSLDSRRPFKLNFVVSITNCSKDVNLDKNPFQCFLNPSVPPRNCHSLIWLKPEAKFISNVDAKCAPLGIARYKRSAMESENGTDYSEIQSMVKASLEQLEMQSLHRYKQRVLQINSHSTKITSGKVTTIDFDVGYTSCLKYEWVANITSCNFLEHLPRRRCVAQIWQRLWIKNGKNIDVNCVDDETPLESHIEFESAEMANELARQALKHIEAKYPHPAKQKVVRIFSLEKQVVAGIHYKMKIEVGFTDCVALSDQKECKLISNHGLNKFCRVNVWIRPWTDHPPNFRVSCDYQEGNTHDLYHQVQAEQLFYNFLTTYSPSYVNNYSQMHKRFEIFKSNIKKIHELNVHEKGTAMYGVTRFTDLTYEEFRTTYMGLNTNLTNENQVPMKQADIPSIKVPENFDWRDYDAVTEVKDQGSCGSCWAFSVTGNIEGQWKMQSGQLVSLSEQELVDCDKLDNGCNGGLPDNAYRAIEQLGGLELESDYPYEGTDDKCAFNKTLAKVQISSAVNITTNETGMAQWLVHNGPISIGINANAMQFYMGGISHPWKALCNPTNLDHGVLIVGYGIKDYPVFHKKIPYWIIKNSWGKSWGEQGYYRVFRGDGTCGVNQMASSAVI